MSQATPPPPPPPLQSLQTVLEGTTPTTSSPPRHSSSSSFKTLSPSLLIIFLILVITVAASISLCLLLRHLNRRCLRHITPSSSASTSAAISDSRRLSSRRVSPETLPTSVSSLPLFTFSSITRRSSTTVAADCAVCLSKFDPDDQLRLLPLCCHAFHALCVDTWLQSHQTCPLCRSPIYASDSELMTLVANAANSGVGNGGSFRLEIGNVSRRRETALSNSGDAQQRRSYSIGSFDYLVDDDSEVHLSNAHRRNGSDYKDDAVVTVIAEAPPPLPPSETNLAADVASGGRSWLKDYIDRLSNSLSSRELSFRSSGRFFTGSSRRSEASSTGDWNLEAGRVGEEITEMFRWLSGV